MNLHVIHHEAEVALAAALAEEAAKAGFANVEAPDADLVLVLVSRAALRDGLGRAPLTALEAGKPVVTVLVGDDPLPPEFPIHRKHAPMARDVATLVTQLTERREQGTARQIDSKRDLFGYGVLLALVQRGA